MISRSPLYRSARNSVARCGVPIAVLNDFDNFFQGFLGTPRREARAIQPQTKAFPLINVWEETDSYRVEAELPGVAADQLEATVEGKELVLKGERTVNKELDAQQARRREASYGSFERKIRFPLELDSEKVEASLKNGVLSLKIAKAVSAQKKKIEVVTH